MTTQEYNDYNFKHILRNRILLAVILGLLILFGTREFSRVRATNIANDLQSALNDSIQTWITEDGLNKGKIATLQARNSKDFTKLYTKDSTIIKLQVLVKENANKISKQGSVTIINTEALVDITSPTTVTDTSKTSSLKDCNPIYTAPINGLGNWVEGETVARRDSTRVTLKFREELDVVIGIDKTGFLGLGKGKPFTEVTLHNPYNKVKVIKSYQTKLPPVKKISIGPGVIYGIGQNFNPGVYVGVGIYYSLIRI